MILDEICKKKKGRVEEAKRRAPLETLALDRTPLDFKEAISKSISIIAEIKKASPSKGVIRKDFSPQDIAKSYMEAKVEALSILTEEDYFLGSVDYLKKVREITNIPILRKDFIIDEYQVYESKAIGADAILLIAAVLDDDKLKKFYTLAKNLGLSVFLEVHDKEEMERAASIGAEIIGINNRDLKTFSEDIKTTGRLLNYAPEGAIIVSESAIRTPNDLKYLKNLGVSAALIGEAFMRQDDIKEAVRNLRRMV